MAACTPPPTMGRSNWRCAPEPTAMASQETESLKRRIVPCPACQGDSEYSSANPYRPFCSERCKSMDLGAWASESFRVPTEAPPDEAPFGDPRLQ